MSVNPTIEEGSFLTVNPSVTGLFLFWF